MNLILLYDALDRGLQLCASQEQFPYNTPAALLEIGWTVYGNVVTQSICFPSSTALLAACASATRKLLLCSGELNLIDCHLNLTRAHSHCHSTPGKNAMEANQYSIKQCIFCNISLKKRAKSTQQSNLQ